MPGFIAHNLSVLAQAAADAPATTSTSLELDWPETGGEWSLFAGFALATAFVVWMYFRDTRSLSRGWTVWLTLLRIGVIAGLVVIALNPQERTQKDAFRPSQVAILVDTSTSMQQPARDPGETGSAEPETRMAVVRDVLTESPLIPALQQTHDVDLYTFDSSLSENLHRFETAYDPRQNVDADSPAGVAATMESPAAPDWNTVLQPRGNSTRLGDAVDTLLTEIKGKTLSGIIIVSDGASNMGRDVRPAIERARAAGVRLISTGVGGVQPPVNVQIARIVAPTDVQLPRADGARDGQDTFEITGYVQAQGLARQTVKVDLTRQYADESQPTVIATEQVTLPDGTAPAVVTFTQSAERKGAVDYQLVVHPPEGVRESRDDDNQVSRTVNVFDEPLQVLLVAGGPMRDYIFAKNVLHRHKSMQVDVWLQTGGPGISQDSHEILFDFPKTREELFAYDVIIAFDPDWLQIPSESQELLEEWVASEGGGLILIAGDVNTSELAAAISDARAGTEHLANLYPVLLEEVRGLGAGERSEEAFPVGLTQEGTAAAFLSLEDQPADVDIWGRLRVFKCYPTRGRKRGATVYAEFTDPQARGRDGQSVLLAGQRYSQGNILYLGSPEIWRLRAVDESFYDRFWIKLVRKAGEGRTRRGVQGSMLIMEGREYDVGQTVPIRARLLNSQFQPLDDAQVTMQVTDPTGRPLVPPLQLERDIDRPSEYTGDLLATVPGRYKLELTIPDTRNVLTGDVSVLLPALEMAELRQNMAVLTQLAEGTGGAYVPIDEAAARIPALLPNMGQQIIIDQQLRELWDRQWVLYLLVGLLCAEWLTRKLLKLA
ncbi:MAG: hypothetical protein JNG89_19750 [Planctomycetaceae bacterium]|nr:hypothetical protein [Planctomycetaceae bacterium]